MSRNSLAGALLLVVILPLSVSAQESAKPHKSDSRRESRIVAAVRAVIDAQRDAWNRGDIEGYMDGYARSPEYSFRLRRQRHAWLANRARPLQKELRLAREDGHA